MRNTVLVAMAMLTTTLTSACGHKVNVAYTAPAQVDLPSDVETVLVVNRALPKNAGETMLDVAEGWATGEGYETDHDTSELALDALVSVLDQTERFDVVQVVVSPDEADSSLFDRPMSGRLAKRLCRVHDCDAIISLDSLDTDSSGFVVRDRNGLSGQTDSSMNASFRVYDGDTGQVIDEARLSGQATTAEGGDVDTAVIAASQGSQHQSDLSYGAGLDYGMRVAPHDVVALRPYYTTGDRQLREAKKAVKAGRWAAAKKIWRDLGRGDDAKLAAKGRYNLALAAELDGRLDRALELANQAARQWSNGRNERYVATVATRIEDQARLDAQLAKVGELPLPATLTRR